MDSSNNSEASESPKTYIERYLEKGFGSMTKNDFEVFIFSELILGEYANSNNYQISCKLKIPESKVKRLRYEANLRYAQDIEIRSRKAFLHAIKQVKLRKDKDNEKVVFIIEDITTRKYLEHRLKENGTFADFSFNSELVVVNINDFVKLILDCYGEEEKDAIKRKIRKDNRKSLEEIVRNAVFSLLKNGTKGAVSVALDKIVEMIEY